MKTITFILVSILTNLSFAQQANDIQYVTGKLYLSLYQQADPGSQILKSIVSGNRLEVLEIAGPYARVITEEGKEGWVKKGFLVKKKPASLLYKEANIALKEVQKELDLSKQINSDVIELKQQIELLQTENSELKQIKDVLKRQQEIKDSRQESTAIEDTPTITQQKIHLDIFKAFIKEYLYFLIAAFILLLLIGFRIGQIKTESDVMKHFGGIKVW